MEIQERERNRSRDDINLSSSRIRDVIIVKEPDGNKIDDFVVSEANGVKMNQ